MKVVIVDYGMGNLKSICGALKYVGVNDIVISSCQEDIQIADKLILPGVGSFSKAMNNICERKLDVCLKEVVLQHKKPILGICLGMQLMSQSSNEDGKTEGLCFVKGHISRFNEGVKIPHVGFNQVAVKNQLKLYQNMHGNMDFYFTHSFRMHNDATDSNQCSCHYGNESFVASYEMGNIAGVQFHPELSQKNGLKLIKNFIDKF